MKTLKMAIVSAAIAVALVSVAASARADGVVIPVDQGNSNALFEARIAANMATGIVNSARTAAAANTNASNVARLGTNDAWKALGTNSASYTIVGLGATSFVFQISNGLIHLISP